MIAELHVEALTFSRAFRNSTRSGEMLYPSSVVCHLMKLTLATAAVLLYSKNRGLSK